MWSIMTAPSRRSFLRSGFAALVAAGGGALIAPPLACKAGEARSRAVGLRPPDSTTPPRVIARTAAIGEVEIGPGVRYRTWMYDGSFPGAEIRARDGERLRIEVANHLPEDTTIHWHGLPVPNAMDGVPGITQAPIAPGSSFAYEFTAGPAGTYMYHTHVGLQLDRGLFGPLIVEEARPHVSYDREYTVILDDYLPTDPAPLSATGGMMGGGMMGGGMAGGATPPYTALLINGRLPASPVAFSVRRGDRVRFRFINPSGATTYRVAIGGHRLAVTHADGRPVQPVTVDNFTISMGERYDAIVDADNPGVWNVSAVPLEVQAPPARALLVYADSTAPHPPANALPDQLRGRTLTLDDLIGIEGNGAEIGPADRRFDLALSGGMMSRQWTINGQAYPNADPIDIHAGEIVEFRMTNLSMMIHPMHLHGHFFQVGRAFKDTVLVPPYMGSIRFRFAADNPGKWFFHCHNLYHMEAGMARVVRYL